MHMKIAYADRIGLEKCSPRQQDKCRELGLGLGLGLGLVNKIYIIAHL